MQQGWTMRTLAVLTAGVVALTGLIAPQLAAPADPAIAAEENGYVVNDPWQLVNPGSASTANTPEFHRAAATMRATTNLQTRTGDIGVTATMTAPGQVAGTNVLTNRNSQGWSGHGATSSMFLGNPTPSNVPGLGIVTNASVCDGPLGSAGHQNFRGLCPITSTVTLTFDRTVTDPVLDLGGIGGWANYTWTNDDPARTQYGKGSFNSQEWVIRTPGVTMSLEGDAPTNLAVTGSRLHTISDNTSGSCGFAEKAGANTRWETPNMSFAGCGSLQLHGTFDEVTFELDTFISRFSQWPTAEYRTGSNYFRNDSNIFADGQNGLNVVWGEQIRIPTAPTDGFQSDYSLLSVRLPQDARLGDRVWVDENENGLQDLGEPGVAGVTAELLDADGSPVLGADGTPLTTTTDDSGQYLFTDLAYGEYRVRFSGIPNGWLFTAQNAGAPAVSSAADPSTGTTGAVLLDAGSHENLDRDAGLLRRDPGFELSKTSDPASGTTVDPGQTITYSVVGANTGDLRLDPVEITDDLSDVLGNATIAGTPSATIDGEPATAPVLDGTTLRWTGSLEPDERVTIRYAVTVDDGAEGETLTNRANASATPPGGTALVPDEVTTSHPVPQPGFEVTKSADPASGTAVHPGQEVRYTVVGSNTGETRLDPVTVTDDLSGVLDDAELVGEPTAMIAGQPATPPTLDGTTLRWTGALAAEQTVTIVYIVLVSEGSEGGRLRNTADGRAVPPAGPPLEAADVSTSHPIPTPGFELRKDSVVSTGGDLFAAGLRAAAAVVSPFAARSADPGDRVDYQITGRNTGGTVLDPVTITDDLSDVLDDASIVVGPAAWIDGVRASDPVIDGTTLRWSGRLEPEQTVDITYTVLVDADAAGQVLRNTASGVAQPPGSAPIREESSVVTPIRTAGFTFDKQSVPASGSTVSPGDEISYTLSARNTGEAPLDPVTISDELDDVLDDASLTGPPVATIDGEPTTDPVLDGTTLRWTGPLNAGERLTIRYTVTVHDDAAGVTVANAATATATPPSGFPPLEPVERSTTHPVPAPGFALEKSAVPASGSTVDPGQEIRYTVTGRNTGATTLDPVRVTDDLTEVLDAAAMVGQPVATIDGEAADAPVLDGNRLRWSGALPVGSSVTIEYTVRVDDGAAGAEFRNHATASAQPPGSATAIVPPAVETDHQVPRPAFDLAKGATPASGSSVDPGQTISYVVTGTNSGETELAVALRDDLSNVLAHATLSAGPSATVDGAPAADPVLDGTTLTWSGTLQPEQVVRLSYTVTVNQDAAGVELENLATGSARPPGSGPAIDPGEHATSHAVPVPGFELAKSADPVSSTEVHPGGTITYTVTGENTGQTRLDPVDVVDDLGAVLDHAEITGAPTARIDGTPATAPTLDGTALRWRGALEPGQTVTITYSVTVSADAAGERLENRASGTAAPPGGPTLTAPEVQTFHPVPEPALELRKRATPPSGSTVAPGGQIAYVVAAENTGETVLDPVTILDDLSEVLNSAELTGTPSAEIDGAPAAAPTLDGDTLRWTGRLERGQTVTLRYTVTVSPEAAGATLRNAVTATAQPPGSGAALESGPRETTHRVPTPSYELAKTAQPASGSTVDPGGRIEYVLTGRNTGETRLDSVAITDDLAEVLANATITSDPIATIDGEPTAMPTVEGTTLRWSGDLDPDQTVEIRYTVTVHDDAAGATLRNRATSTAQPPGTGPALVPPAQETTHEVPTPSYEFTKAADPASGTSVNPGDEIEYTLAGRNTGETGLQVAIEDELAEVLAHATISEAPIATIDGEPAAAPTVQGTTLRWSGALRPEQTVEIRYTVTVHDDAAGSTLRNRATSTAQPPGTGPALVPEPRETTHPVPTPGYTFAKRADPASGTSVNPGDEIEYTLTGRNTGETPLDPVAITDELAEVLADATITSDPIATIDGAPATAPTIDGTTLRWSGALRPEQTVEIRYTVAVHDDAAGATLRNHARSTAQPPGTGPALSPPPQETTHPVPVPGFTLGKVADPATGSAVHPGERISYTITGRNTGATPLDPVRISDELGGVLGNAALDGAPLATVDGEPAAAPVVDGSTLSWTGSLQRGQVVTIRYTVTVAEDAAGSSLRNLVTGTAQPPGTGPAVDGGRHETVHAVPVPGFELSKAADPASGSVVHPGQTVTYTLTGENTGETVLDPVAIRDELGEVLAHGALRGSPVATVDGEDAPAPTLDGTVLNWSGALRAGQTVTIRYTVVVDQDAAGVTLRNSASGTAIPPGGPALDAPEVATSHEVPVSGYDLTKSATPADGSVVSPGEQVRYTLTGVNTGETLLDPVEIRDDLSQVLANAALAAAPEATIDGAPAPAPVIDGELLRWTGALEPGQRVEITYTVTVSDEAAGRLRNTATSTATPPGGPRIESGERSTSHPIPAIELAKRAELTGTGVAGDVIDYTFTITNTGGTRLDDVVLRDPLPGLGELRYAWPDPGAPGVLEIGQTATASASYTLTQADVDAGSVRNTATVTGTPPGDGTPLVTDEDGTSTPAEQRAAIALEKTGRASGDRAGELVEFRFLVTNTGTVTLREVAIDDPLPGLSALRFIWPDASAPGVLAPGESATATANYRLTAADVERGRVHNAASATGAPPGSLTPPRASDETTVAVGGLPATGVSLGTGVLAAFLLAAGALLLPARRRRSVRRAEE